MNGRRRGTGDENRSWSVFVHLRRKLHFGNLKQCGVSPVSKHQIYAYQMSISNTNNRLPLFLSYDPFVAFSIVALVPWMTVEQCTIHYLRCNYLMTSSLIVW